jgi:hypothetical protein
MTHQMDEPATCRLVSAQETQRSYEEARAEAQHLWNASFHAITQRSTAAERLAAVQLARDVAFTLWCDLAAAARPARDEGERTL